MRAWRSLAIWILIAAAVHAVILLLPRPAGQAGEGIPTIELTLEEAGPGPAGPPAQPPGPAQRPRAAPPAPQPVVSAAAAPPAAPAQDPAPPELSTPEEETAVDTTPAADTTQAAAPAAAPTGDLAPGGAGPAGAGAASGSGAAGTGSGTGGGDHPGGPADALAAGLTPPRPLVPISPAYPRSARASGAQGTVRIRALVDPSGKVISADLSSSSGAALLDQAALEAVRHAVFQPAVQRGKAVPCWLIIPIRFQLK